MKNLTASLYITPCDCCCPLRQTSQDPLIDLLIVLAFVVYAVVVGFRSRRSASRSLRNYFLAGGDIAGWQAGVSMAATQYAADTPLLATGLIATGGVYLLWRFWIYGFGYLILAFVFAECWRRSKVLTDAELTELRYSGRGVLALRVLKAVYYGTIVNCFFLAMVLIAALRIADVFLPWHHWLPHSAYASIVEFVNLTGLRLDSGVHGLPLEFATANGLISISLITAFILLYSTVGGLKAVVATDVMQFAFMSVGTLAYAVLVVVKVGGLSQIGPQLSSIYGQGRSAELLSILPSGESAIFPFLMLIGLQGLFWISSDGSGYLAQRSMACRSDHDARLAGIVLTWLQVLGRSLVWLVVGVGLLIIYPFTPQEAISDDFAATREMTFVMGIRDLMPLGLRGIAITGMLAALASTVDTHLNWGASYWSNDLYDRLLCQEWLRRRPNHKELVWVARLSNLVILLLALLVMCHLGSIQATWFVSLVFGAGIGGVLMLRWLWDRINLYSEITAIAISLLLAPVLIASVETEWIRLGWMVSASLVGSVAVTFVTPRTENAVLERFCRQVEPFGWWHTKASNHGVWRLGIRLKWTTLMASSLFLFLMGLARVLIPLSWVSPYWGWGFLVAGFALVPWWWPALRSQTF